MITAVDGETYPAAGVIVTNPATAPVSNPKNFGFFSLNHATSIHVTAANEGATSVFKNAVAVTESTRISLPALNPYHPNHSRPVPSATRGILCGPRSRTLRFPTYSTDASAAIPAMLWTTIPPAKSFTPHCCSTPPPQTMCTNGKYTNVSHPVRNIIYALNDTRFVNAPEISAGVIIANIIWYAMNTIIGMVSFGDGVESPIPTKQTFLKFPITPCQSPLKHSENPYKYQITVVHPIETKLWIMMASTFFRPTSPP